MVKVTTQDSSEELYNKFQEYLAELYDILTTGVKLGILIGHLEGRAFLQRM